MLELSLWQTFIRPYLLLFHEKIEVGKESYSECSFHQVNAVEIPSRGGFSIRAVYPQLAIAAHNCVPNIVHTILTNDYQ